MDVMGVIDVLGVLGVTSGDHGVCETFTARRLAQLLCRRLARAHDGQRIKGGGVVDEALEEEAASLSTRTGDSHLEPRSHA